MRSDPVGWANNLTATGLIENSLYPLWCSLVIWWNLELHYLPFWISSLHWIYKERKTNLSRNNYFFLTFSIDSSFNHLESLFLINIDSNILTLLLSTLPNVPRLFSLSIVWLNDLSDVYRLIFSLSKLKYAKCSSDDYGISVLPMATYERLNLLLLIILVLRKNYLPYHLIHQNFVI